MRLIILFLGISLPLCAQQSIVSGYLVNTIENEFLTGVTITVEGTNINTVSDESGAFTLKTNFQGDYILLFKATGYLPKRIPLLLEGELLDLGDIFLQKDIATEQTDNLVTLTDAQLADDNGIVSNASGLLQATRDVFLNRAAFDFSQAFFRVRGYDSRNGQVLINGIAMNQFFNGRPQWNHWGGLNDVVRNQSFSNGLDRSEYTFGGILGNTNINTRPSRLRTGTRLSASASNRTYTGRLMATHTSGQQGNGFSYTVSASRRWAQEGYVDGTLYDAFSFFGTVEYQVGQKNSMALTAIVAKNRRGRSAPITEEVFELAGNRYNPYWGEQNGNIRNARERDIFEPTLMLNHFFETNNLKITSGAAYQFGQNSRSRLGYFNAPNPEPTYYRYLPSFYVNNRIGADFTNAGLAREGFLQNSQLNWNTLYSANRNIENEGKASYLFYDDIADTNRLNLSSIANWFINDHFTLDFGMSYRSSVSQNFAEIKDLLGANFHEDIDPFSNTLNDINGNRSKVEGDIFSYHYKMDATEWNAFTQASTHFGPWEVFAAVSVSNTAFRRYGLFQNERFSNSSEGKSESISFFNYALKGSLGYRFSGRHWLKVNGASLNRPPILQNAFVNPRENNELVPNLESDRIASMDINYFIRLPDVTGRVSAFYTRFMNTTDINFFFVDAGVGSDFVQEVITGLDRLHKGIELGFEYQASPTVKLSAVANLGEYTFASDPSVTINFDTAGQEEPIDQTGNLDLGIAKIKDLKLAQGPQTAVALGIEYRDPKYWWLGATANYLADNFAAISTITRTQSFLLNPETGERFIDATEENVSALLQQNKMDDFYLLNLVGGKSWLKNGKYISVFASINNVFDTVFRTGGFEQSRNGNFGQLQQDNLRNNPTFAPKYWYGFGRTYFLNVAFSF